MKISKGYGELLRVGITLFLAVMVYQLVVVQLLGNKAYDLRVARNVFLFTPQQQFVPVLLLSCFIVYFIGEHKFQYKRAGWNLLILFCGLSVLILTFLFAKHIHQLYMSTAHKFDSMPKNMGQPTDMTENPVRFLWRARNVLLGIDAVLALLMIYLWYNWAEVEVKK